MRAIPKSATSPGCSGSARTVIAPRSVAQAFADYLNSVLNRTVTDARLTLLPIPGQESQFNLACFEHNERVPFALHGVSKTLFISQAIEVDDDHCRTVSYGYRLQTGADRKSWLIRWEYFREPPRKDYVYPRAHCHVNATFVDADAADELAKPASHLHVPTARLPLELVLWHVIAEWGVSPKTSDWQDILVESLQGFEQRRRAT